jgi:hypothetical protein
MNHLEIKAEAAYTIAMAQSDALRILQAHITQHVKNTGDPVIHPEMIKQIWICGFLDGYIAGLDFAVAAPKHAS